MKDIKKIIKTFTHSNDKLWFGDTDLITVNPQSTLCIMAKDSKGIFEKNFGTHNAKNFLNALNLFEECEFVFKDPYIIIKDTKSKKKFKYKLAEEDVMQIVIDKNYDGVNLFKSVADALENNPYIKIKITDDQVKEYLSVAATHRLDTLEFKYDGGDKVKISIKNVEQKSSEFDNHFDVEKGKCGEFTNYIDIKYLVNDDWDVYFIEDKPFLFLENEEFKIAIVYAD